MSDFNKSNIYQALPTLTANAETTSWSRFNNYLLFNSVLILSWVSLYKKAGSSAIFLTAISILGLIISFVWACLGLRGRNNVNLFLRIGKEIEAENNDISKDIKPFTEAIKLRDTQYFSLCGSIYVLTFGPLLVSILYALLLFMSISNPVAQIIYTIAVILITVFIGIILEKIKRMKNKENNT